MQVRDTVELVFILTMGALILHFNRTYPDMAQALVAAIVVLGAGKTIYFGGESLWHLLQASAKDVSYHRFLRLMALHMVQIAFSFAVDYYCLQEVRPGSFNGVDPALGEAEEMFEFFFLSVLNFSFFGFGDVTPATVPGKLLTLMEVGLSFLTLIFLLSDFVSIKESLRRRA